MKTNKINQIQALLLELREVNPDMNINMMLALFEVAKGQGVTGKELEDKFDFPTATAARLLRYFDPINKEGRKGQALFDVRLDRIDYRAKLRFLNEEGEKLFDRLDTKLKTNQSQ